MDFTVDLPHRLYNCIGMIMDVVQTIISNGVEVTMVYSLKSCEKKQEVTIISFVVLANVIMLNDKYLIVFIKESNYKEFYNCNNGNTIPLQN